MRRQFSATAEAVMHRLLLPKVNTSVEIANTYGNGFLNEGKKNLGVGM